MFVKLVVVMILTGLLVAADYSALAIPFLIVALGIALRLPLGSPHRPATNLR